MAIFSLAELEERISAYANFDAFVDWYRRSSRGKFGAPKEVLDACMKIDAALSEFYFDGADERLFRQELANAVRPFALSEILVFSDSKHEQAMPATKVFRFWDRAVHNPRWGTTSTREKPTVVRPSRDTESATEPQLGQAVG